MQYIKKDQLCKSDDMELRFTFRYVLKMWRMAILIRHNCGERKSTVGHRCPKSFCVFFTVDHSCPTITNSLTANGFVSTYFKMMGGVVKVEIYEVDLELIACCRPYNPSQNVST